MYFEHRRHWDGPFDGLRVGVAIADWYHAPEVDEIDLAAWTGDVGEALRARVRDDVQVETMQFVTTAEDGTLR